MPCLFSRTDVFRAVFNSNNLRPLANNLNVTLVKIMSLHDVEGINTTGFVPVGKCFRLLLMIQNAAIKMDAIHQSLVFYRQLIYSVPKLAYCTSHQDHEHPET